MLKEKDRCPKCWAWHGVPPLEYLSPDEPCEHDPTRLCTICKQPVGVLSMGGPTICGWCDSGEDIPEENNAKDIAKELVKKFEEMGRNGELKDIFHATERDKREQRRRRIFSPYDKIGPLAYQV